MRRVRPGVPNPGNRGAILRAKHPISKRQRRREAKRAALKEEIMVFAGRMRSDPQCAQDMEFLKKMSLFTERGSLSELIKYKRGIQRGNENADYPLERILESNKRSGEIVAGFLGPQYLTQFVKILSRKNNLSEKALAEKALGWAMVHGSERMKHRALAGIAYAAAAEMESCSTDFRLMGYSRAKGLMGMLSSKIGERKAEKIVNGINGMKEYCAARVAGVCALCGIFGGIAAGALSRAAAGENMHLGWGIMGLGCAIMGIGIIAEAMKASMWGVERALGKGLRKLQGDGQL